MPAAPNGYSEIVTGLTRIVDRLRNDLREALEAVLPTLDGARACGRALGLKRGLGWKVFTVATSSDLPTAIAALPREAGWHLVCVSLQRARCPQRKLDELRRTIAELQEFLDQGRLGRPMLKAIAAGQLDNPRETTALLASRRAVREGCEGIYGIQCATQLGMYVIGAPDEAGRVSFTASSIHDGLRRLRPGPGVAIRSLTRAWHPSRRDDQVGQPLGSCARTGWLVADLSTPDVWDEHLVIRGAPDLPIVCFESLDAKMDQPVRAVFSELMPHGGTAGQSDDRVDLHIGISIPTSRCVFEAWIHRSIQPRTEPAAGLAGSIGTTQPLSSDADLVPLPLESRAQRLEKPALPTGFRAISKVHAELLARSARTLGADPSDFIGYRITLPDPPIGSRVMLRWRM